MPEAPHRGGTFASLRVRNYRLYFAGQAVSLVGTWMQVVAMSWLALELTHSGTAIGLVLAVARRSAPLPAHMPTAFDPPPAA